jgi:hypothetical protein
LAEAEALALLGKTLNSDDQEEMALGLTVCTNLSAGEINGSMFFEDGRLLKHVLEILEFTDKPKKDAKEQQLRDIAMLALSNFSVNPSLTTRMVDQGALPHILKSFKNADVGMERHHTVKALCYISQDGSYSSPSFATLRLYQHPHAQILYLPNHRL